MIDPKPLLFANFLAVMLLVTAGFATIQRSPELVGAEKPDPNAIPTGEAESPTQPATNRLSPDLTPFRSLSRSNRLSRHQNPKPMLSLNRPSPGLRTLRCAPTSMGTGF